MGGDNGAGEIKELDEGQELDESDYRVLVDEEGNERTCVLLAIVEYEEHDYAMLTPVEELESDKEEMEVYLFEYRQDEEAEHFIAIEDDELYQKVASYCGTLMELDNEPVIEA